LPCATVGALCAKPVDRNDGLKILIIMLNQQFNVRAKPSGEQPADAVASTDGATLLGLERAKGIEPSYAAWEAAVLPLNYARTRP
jgi:hypothetical protein